MDYLILEQLRSGDLRGGNWVRLGSRLTGDLNRYRFGSSIALNAEGNILAVSNFNDTNNFGEVSIYEFDNTDWVLKGNVLVGADAGDGFGASIDLNDIGDRIVVGSPGSNALGTQSGAIDIFEFSSSGEWVRLYETYYGTVSNESFGSNVNLDAAGDTVLVGLSSNDEGGLAAGAMKIYQPQTISCVVTQNIEIIDSSLNPPPSNPCDVLALNFPVDVKNINTSASPVLLSGGSPAGGIYRSGSYG